METKLWPVLALLIRLQMGWIFLASGWLKFSNYLNDNWDATIYLFSDVTPVPFLPPQIAAVLGTAGELGFSVMLMLGIFSRLGALGLLCMTGVIELSFRLHDAEYTTLPVHPLWALLLAVILVRGPGAISLDGLLCKWMKCSNSSV